MSITKKNFTYLIVLFPLLSVYFCGIATLTIADILLILLLPFLFLELYRGNNSKKMSFFFITLIYYMILQLLINCGTGSANSESALTTLRLILYYFIIGLFMKEFFDIKLGFKIYKKVSVIASIYYIIQFILLKVFNIFISGTLPFFKTSVDNYNTIMSNHAWTSSAYARPRSFFSEPSHFAIYVALCLALLLYKKNKNDLKYILIITIAMLLSGSGMAIILSVIIYGITFVKNLNKISKRTIMITLIGVILAIPIGAVYLKSESFNIFYNRTFVQRDSTEGRFGNFAEAFKKKKSTKEIIFGEGVYKIEDVEGQDYITSIPRIYTYFGIVGSLFFVFTAIYNLKKLSGMNRISWIILLAISFAGEILFHNLVFTYVPYILCKEGNDV